MSAPWRRLGLTLLALTLAVACRSALRTPPALEALIETAGGAIDGEAAPLLERAERAFATGSIEGAKEAVRAWLSAARLPQADARALAGASRGQVWLSDRLEDETARREAAIGAVQAAQLCGERFPDAPRCGYRLAVALGAQARERRSTGLDALPRIVALLERAIAEIPEIDHSGPDRVLALVYLRAPGWPTGPGDADLGLEHAEAAVARDPAFPPNLLALGEALAAVDEPQAAADAFGRAIELARRSEHPQRQDWSDEAQRALSGLDGE